MMMLQIFAEILYTLIFLFVITMKENIDFSCMLIFIKNIKKTIYNSKSFLFNIELHPDSKKDK